MRLIKLACVTTSLIQMLNALGMKVQLRKTQCRLKDKANEYLDNELNMYQKRHIRVYCKDLNKTKNKIRSYMLLSFFFLLLGFLLPEKEVD